MPGNRTDGKVAHAAQKIFSRPGTHREIRPFAVVDHGGQFQRCPVRDPVFERPLEFGTVNLLQIGYPACLARGWTGRFCDSEKVGQADIRLNRIESPPRCDLGNSMKRAGCRQGPAAEPVIAPIRTPRHGSSQMPDHRDGRRNIRRVLIPANRPAGDGIINRRQPTMAIFRDRAQPEARTHDPEKPKQKHHSTGSPDPADRQSPRPSFHFIDQLRCLLIIPHR